MDNNAIVGLFGDGAESSCSDSDEVFADYEVYSGESSTTTSPASSSPPHTPPSSGHHGRHHQGISNRLSHMQKIENRQKPLSQQLTPHHQHVPHQLMETTIHPTGCMLPPEDAEGNVEYKLKLVDPSESRFEHLVTQMKWRLREGQGEAIYEIGSYVSYVSIASDVPGVFCVVHAFIVILASTLLSIIRLFW